MGGRKSEPAKSHHLPERLRVERLDDFRWLIPRQGRMNVDGIVYADERMMASMQHDQALRQVASVACLPGIVGKSIGMPDIHWGYGFAIGGVAAFDPDAGGVVSPGGVGYDINCGVRLLRSDLSRSELGPALGRLMDSIRKAVPAGVGSHHAGSRLRDAEVEAIATRGAAWAVERGWGTEDDLLHTESQGALPDADPDRISARAIERGRSQLGTVGSGNHFIEVGVVGEIFDEAAAEALRLELGTITVLIHSGSRGLGHQVCTDALDVMLPAAGRYGIDLPDRQLACAPLTSPEARQYMGAMSAAANFAFANRQTMAHLVRGAFAKTLDRPWESLGLELVYDVAHNIAKWEEHVVDGQSRRLCVHRKGATRAFPAGHPDLPDAVREVGQPVLIPGDMGRYSYVLVGTAEAYEQTFGSTCHGAGRVMSRTKAKKSVRSSQRDLEREFRNRGIEVRAASFATIAEEIPEAYKDVADVVDIVDRAGIGRKVAKLLPLGVLKG